MRAREEPMSPQHIKPSEIPSPAQGDRQFLSPVPEARQNLERTTKEQLIISLGPTLKASIRPWNDVFKTSGCALGFGFQPQWGKPLTVNPKAVSLGQWNPGNTHSMNGGAPSTLKIQSTDEQSKQLYFSYCPWPVCNCMRWSRDDLYLQRAERKGIIKCVTS